MRNLKVLGFALLALFAMAAVTASAASAANGRLTSTGPFTLTGTDEATGNHLTYPGEPSVTCPESHYSAHKWNVTPHEAIPSGAETITVIPVYTNCTTEGHKATVTGFTGECDYVYHIGETVAGGTNEYKLTTDLKCNTGGHVTMEFYLAANNENVKVCSITFGEAGNQGLAGPTIKEVEANKFRIKGTFTGITATKEGLCGAGATNMASYDVDVTLSGEKSNGEATAVSLSHL
jgi:hypothetical protein